MRPNEAEDGAAYRSPPFVTAHSVALSYVRGSTVRGRADVAAEAVVSVVETPARPASFASSLRQATGAPSPTSPTARRGGRLARCK
jgi:hypothetical protein